MHQEAWIEIFGAREHNLKNLDLRIPRNRLVVITGVSGSGKSSLAFDTLYAEGQRRYLESFSAYARQFLGDLKSPDVDKIDGLSPVIAIEQKTTSRNPRSTVGTVTEIYDLFRLLYARAADAYSYKTGRKMVQMSDEQVLEAINEQFPGRRMLILAPLVRSRKGHYRELFETLARQGFNRVRIDGEVREITRGMMLDRYKIHDVELVVDRIAIGADANRERESIQRAMKMGEGAVLLVDADSGAANWYSRNLMDPETGLSYDVPSPNTFSFNSPYGACPHCNGLGQVFEVDMNALVPDPALSINRGALAPIGEYRDIWFFKQLRKIADAYKFSMAGAFQEIPEEARTLILEGDHVLGKRALVKFDGVKQFVYEQYQNSSSEKLKSWAEQFMRVATCPECNGARLRPESLWYRLAETNIHQVSTMDIATLTHWVDQLEPKLSEKQRQIAGEVLKELRKRIGFLHQVGLDYLSLDRPARTLSGGEAQRIRLATQIGSQLVNVLYILDEPSIGLHQRDNEKLIQSLLDLRDLGNSVLVVEHDKDTMLAADYIVDFGPGAGAYGGNIVAQGTPAEFLEQPCATSGYLSGRRSIQPPAQRRTPQPQRLVLEGAAGNNLRDVTLHLPLGIFVCVTGVSGSGKSTLINETLFPLLSQTLYESKQKPLAYRAVQGLEHLNKVVRIDQAPIGRTPRSNPATYTNLFTYIRELFAQLPESQARGYKVGRFSFNVKGGRCEECEGAGVKTIEMNFLPDVYVTCPKCQGRRYNRETLEVRFKGKSINDVLNMDIDTALEFFEAMPRIRRILKTLHDVGLGYITLGQPATTLSGGEAQRVKVAAELARRDTGNTLYILDEPTTGLHFQDIELLLDVLQQLVDRGNTVLVIEHNLDVIKVADWVIDLGPEGGARGGHIIAEGTPEQVALVPESHTGRFLKRDLGL
ncbi:MAG: excinuclease ABC subunit UvrA [Bacteroidia bacterium]|nr:excinuclease ABC subunit UvrA [Bacteroidia bacterium]